MATTLLAAATKSALGPQSAAAKYVRKLPAIRTNVSSTERAVSLSLGAGLMSLGFDCRGPSLLSSLAGGYLLYRAATESVAAISSIS